MSFISINFAFFVILVLLLYYIIPIRYRWIVLLAASYIFYALAGVKYIAFIFLTSLSTYGIARYVEKIDVKVKNHIRDNKDTLTKEDKKMLKTMAKSNQRWLLFLCLLINVGVLFILKYGDFFIAYFNYYRLTLTGNINLIPQPNFILPLGISFYTLQAVGYLVDVYYGKCKAEKNFFKFALFISFFPQILQGPISRFNDLSEMLINGHGFNFYNIKSGFCRIIWGLFKKLVIADRIAPYVKTSMELAETFKGPYIILGVLLYGFQLYGDFSGGIDIAIGVAKMFGIELAENFERPFFSKSIAEFWRRWHITLGTWFRDYIFYPLSISKNILKLGKKVRKYNDGLGKRLPIYIPMIMVWILTGMWHGSQSRYVVWGLLNCVFIILGTEFEPLSAKIVSKLGLSEERLIVKSYRIIKTFLLMSALRMFDICGAPKNTFSTFILMFKGWREFSFDIIESTLKLSVKDMIVAVIAIIVLFIVELIQTKGSLRDKIFASPAYVQWITLSVLTLVVIIFGYYGYGYDSGAFLYMQY